MSKRSVLEERRRGVKRNTASGSMTGVMIGGRDYLFWEVSRGDHSRKRLLKQRLVAKEESVEGTGVQNSQERLTGYQGLKHLETHQGSFKPSRIRRKGEEGGTDVHLLGAKNDNKNKHVSPTDYEHTAKRWREQRSRRSIQVLIPGARGQEKTRSPSNVGNNIGKKGTVTTR